MPSIHYDIAHLLGALVLLLSFALLYQRRLFALIQMFAIQSAALGAAAAWQGYIRMRRTSTSPPCWRSA